ncbi:hypothetical protein HMPREF1980_01407 [Actinomyces sp. oral taxon 172 str. F0311]|nr:hypothetical protein HMPREF1980_01407 [Actinomyces sp. oral taxon 172 str. F0311]
MNLIAVQEPLLGAARGRLRRSPGVLAWYTPPGPRWRAISRHTTEGLRPIKWAIHVWDKPAFTPAIIAARSSTPSIRRHPMISLQTASPLHENCLHPMTLPTYKCVRGQDSHTPNHPLRPYRHDHPTTAVATPKRKRDTKSIHSPTETRTFAGEALLYSFPVNDDRRGGSTCPKYSGSLCPSRSSSCSTRANPRGPCSAVGPST